MPNLTLDQTKKEIDYLLDFALFLEEEERSAVTIKNYLCDLKYERKMVLSKKQSKIDPKFNYTNRFTRL